MPFGRPDAPVGALSAPADTRVVKAMNLGERITPLKLQQGLQQWGVSGIAEVQCRNGKNGLFAYIKVKTTAEAELMMQANGIKIDGRPVVLQLAPPTFQFPAPASGSQAQAALAAPVTQPGPLRGEPQQGAVQQREQQAQQHLRQQAVAMAPSLSATADAGAHAAKAPVLQVSDLPPDVTSQEVLTFLRSLGVLGIQEIDIDDDEGGADTEPASAFVLFEHMAQVQSAMLKAYGASYCGQQVALQQVPRMPPRSTPLPRNSRRLKRNPFPSTLGINGDPKKATSPSLGLPAALVFVGDDGEMPAHPPAGEPPEGATAQSPGPPPPPPSWPIESAPGSSSDAAAARVATTSCPGVVSSRGGVASVAVSEVDTRPAPEIVVTPQGPRFRPPTWMSGHFFVHISNVSPLSTRASVQEGLTAAGVQGVVDMYLDADKGGGIVALRTEADARRILAVDGIPIDGYNLLVEVAPLNVAALAVPASATTPAQAAGLCSGCNGCHLGGMPVTGAGMGMAASGMAICMPHVAGVGLTHTGPDGRSEVYGVLPADLTERRRMPASVAMPSPAGPWAPSGVSNAIASWAVPRGGCSGMLPGSGGCVAGSCTGACGSNFTGAPAAGCPAVANLPTFGTGGGSDLPRSAAAGAGCRHGDVGAKGSCAHADACCGSSGFGVPSGCLVDAVPATDPPDPKRQRLAEHGARGRDQGSCLGRGGAAASNLGSVQGPALSVGLNQSVGVS